MGCRVVVFNIFFDTPIAQQASAASTVMVLWYNKPADSIWHDGLLIGSGYIGANVFGRVHEERIALNESTFWSGRPHDYNDTGAYRYFEKIKELVFDGKFMEAEKMANRISTVSPLLNKHINLWETSC